MGIPLLILDQDQLDFFFHGYFYFLLYNFFSTETFLPQVHCLRNIRPFRPSGHAARDMRRSLHHFLNAKMRAVTCTKYLISILHKPCIEKVLFSRKAVEQTLIFFVNQSFIRRSLSSASTRRGILALIEPPSLS